MVHTITTGMLKVREHAATGSNTHRENMSTSTTAFFTFTPSPLVRYGVREHTATESNMHRKTCRTYVRTCKSALSISWQSY